MEAWPMGPAAADFPGRTSSLNSTCCVIEPCPCPRGVTPEEGHKLSPLGGDVDADEMLWGLCRINAAKCCRKEQLCVLIDGRASGARLSSSYQCTPTLPGRQKFVSATKVGVKITDVGLDQDMLEQDEFLPMFPAFRLLCDQNSRSWDVPSFLRINKS